jgi:hypothetical protein
MNYIIPRVIPLADQFDQAFFFTIDKRVCTGQNVPIQLLLSKNLTELDTLSLDKLRKIAKKLNIPALHSMNKNVLSTHIRNYIVFE